MNSSKKTTLPIWPIFDTLSVSYGPNQGVELAVPVILKITCILFYFYYFFRQCKVRTLIITSGSVALRVSALPQTIIYTEMLLQSEFHNYMLKEAWICTKATLKFFKYVYNLIDAMMSLKT